MSKAKSMLDKIYQAASQKLGELVYAKKQLEAEIQECHVTIAQLNKMLPPIQELDASLQKEAAKDEPTSPAS